MSDQTKPRVNPAKEWAKHVAQIEATCKAWKEAKELRNETPAPEPEAPKKKGMRL